MAKRIAYVAFHSSFHNRSPEYRLWQAGKPFLAGYHFFDDPEVVRRNTAGCDVYEGRTNTDIDLKPSMRRVMQYSEQNIPAPPTGGYAHGSFCIFNKEDGGQIVRCLATLLQRDPGLHLLVVVREGYSNFVEALKVMQDEPALRKRHYSVFHRAGGPKLPCIEGDDRATLKDDLWLWRNCDRRVISNAAAVQRPAYASWLLALRQEGAEPAFEFFNPHDSLANVMTMVGWAQEFFDKA
jgi:hypothetical protein